jgi:hypothetical protein
MAAQYFGRLMVDRQLLFWTVTTRRQLERWEACVAELVSLGLRSEPEPGQLVWRGEAEHHCFMFLAARNLVRAAEVAAESLIETSFAETLKDVRDLLEHWDQNMPIFNGNSKEVPPRPSGKRFAARNPTATPYWSSEWNSKQGPLLFLQDRRRPSSMMRSIEWKASCSRDAPNLSSTYQNEPISRGSATAGVKIDGFPSPPRIRARPTDIAQLAPEARARLPHSGRWATSGATSGPRTSRSQPTIAVTTGPASASLPGTLPCPPQVARALLRSLTRKRSQVQTLSRPPAITAAQAGSSDPDCRLSHPAPGRQAANGQQPRTNRRADIALTGAGQCAGTAGWRPAYLGGKGPQARGSTGGRPTVASSLQSEALLCNHPPR